MIILDIVLFCVILWATAMAKAKREAQRDD